MVGLGKKILYIFCLPPACSSMIIITVLRPGRFSVVVEPITLIEIVVFACYINRYICTLPMYIFMSYRVAMQTIVQKGNVFAQNVMEY